MKRPHNDGVPPAQPPDIAPDDGEQNIVNTFFTKFKKAKKWQ